MHKQFCQAGSAHYLTSKYANFSKWIQSEQLKDSWFLHWQDGKVYGLPKKSEPPQPFGEAVELDLGDD